MIDLSIVIVSYNTKTLLLDCLKSITENSKDLNNEIIIVDNASSDGSVKELKEQLPTIKVIENRENLGFAKANNQGIQVSTGRYILLLNSDTKIINNALSRMVNWMDDHKKVGISTCSLINEDQTVQPTGGYFPTLPRVLAWSLFLDDLPFYHLLFKPYHPKEGFYNKEKEMDWVTGAFFLIRKEVIGEVGLLDENFFMYAEELEYCYRSQKHGFKIFFTPVAKVVHYKMKSGSEENALVGEYKGLKYIYKRHFPPQSSLVLSMLLKTGAVLRFALMGLLMHNKTFKEAYVKCFKVA